MSIRSKKHHAKTDAPIAPGPESDLATVSQDQSSSGAFKRTLTVPDMVVYGLIFMVPIAPMGIYGGIFDDSGGMPALVYIIGSAAMVFTALSYGMLVEKFPYSGSVYSYTSRGLCPGIGFVSGWALLLDYLLIPLLMYVTAATALHSIFPFIPFYAWGIFFVVVVTAINLLGVQLTDVINRFALVAELIVLAIFIGLAIYWVATNPASHGFTFDPIFDPATFDLSKVMAGVSLGVLSFLGFDGIATLSEEAKDGRKGPGRAMMISLILVGALFVIQSYMAALVSPSGAVFQGNESHAFYLIAEVVGGYPMYVACAVATAIAWGIFTALAAQTAVTRILYSMGKTNSLPKALSKLSKRYNTPYVAILLVGGLTLVLFLTVGSLGVDVISLFVNFGALTAFFILHVTVIGYFWVKKKEHNLWKHMIVPICGMIVIGFTWLSLDTEAKILGVSWVAVGTIYYLVSKYALHRKIEIADG